MQRLEGLRLETYQDVAEGIDPLPSLTPREYWPAHTRRLGFAPSYPSFPAQAGIHCAPGVPCSHSMPACAGM